MSPWPHSSFDIKELLFRNMREKVLLGEVAFLREKQKSNKKRNLSRCKILKWGGVEFFRIKEEKNVMFFIHLQVFSSSEEIKGKMLSSVLIQEHLLSTAQTRGRCPCIQYDLPGSFSQFPLNLSSSTLLCI